MTTGTLCGRAGLRRRAGAGRSSSRVLVSILLGALTALGGAGDGRAQIGPPPDPSTSSEDPLAESSECCLVLLLPVGARAVSLGQTMSARASPDAAFANPAGLASLDDGHFVFHHSSTAVGQADALSVLLNAGPVGTFGVSYQLFDYGEIPTTNDDRVTTGVLSLRDHVVVASFGTEVYGGIAGGVNLKLYQFRIDCRGACSDYEVVATTQAVDFGVHFRPPWMSHLQLGAALTNLGFDIQVVNAQQSDPPPSRGRIGVAYEVMHHVPAARGTEMWLGVEAVDRLREPGGPHLSVGAEFAAGDAVYLRAGYVPGEGLDSGTAVGVGVRRDRFTVAVSKTLTSTALDPESEPFQVSFGLRF